MDSFEQGGVAVKKVGAVDANGQSMGSENGGEGHATQFAEACVLHLLQNDPRAYRQRLSQATVAELEGQHDRLRAMLPLNTQNPFWQRRELPFALDGLDRTINMSLDKIEELLGTHHESKADAALSGSVGKHDWAIGARTGSGYLVFVDDRPLSYMPSVDAGTAYAHEVIARLVADGDYRLNDRPAGFMPPMLKLEVVAEAIEQHVTEKHGHPWTQQGDWDLLEAKAATEEDLSAFIERAEREHWKVWMRDNTGKCVVAMYRPHQVREPWDDDIRGGFTLTKSASPAALPDSPRLTIVIANSDSTCHIKQASLQDGKLVVSDVAKGETDGYTLMVRFQLEQGDKPVVSEMVDGDFWRAAEDGGHLEDFYESVLRGASLSDAIREAEESWESRPRI